MTLAHFDAQKGDKEIDAIKKLKIKRISCRCDEGFKNRRGNTQKKYKKEKEKRRGDMQIQEQ